MEPLMIRCPACGATNRVATDKVAAGRAPVCGKCRAPLPLGTPQPVTDASFAQEVERSPVPVLVDAWAPWCGPCHMIAPVIDQLAGIRSGKNYAALPKQPADDDGVVMAVERELGCAVVEIEESAPLRIQPSEKLPRNVGAVEVLCP